MAVLSMSDEELRRLEVVRDVDRGVFGTGEIGGAHQGSSGSCVPSGTEGQGRV
ncbi:MAG: hypothetical protein JO266_12015 [Acidobacteria bacterium]|nr:hypothetical protein [Acidobacteriota bacterium]